MIYGANHQPAANSEILARLHEIDPDFGLKWMSALRCWAVTMAWSHEDSRRILVKKGDVAEEDARDMFCQLPEDCSASEAYGYLVNNLRASRGRDDVKRLLDRVHLYNKQREQQALQPALDLADELIEHNAPNLFAHAGKSTVRFVGGKKR